MTDTERALQAETLVNALPYIQKYRDKIIVVKYGGNMAYARRQRYAQRRT